MHQFKNVHQLILKMIYIKYAGMFKENSSLSHLTVT